VALSPTTGWAVLHLFCRLTPDFDANALRKAVSAAEADGYQVVPVALLGAKGDLGLMALGPDQWRLRQFQTDVAAAGAVVSESYVSLTEVSEYAAGVPEEMRQARLYPQLPPDGKAAFCFYPMSKRRGAGEGENWYRLSFDARKELMVGHGRVGRTFHGRVLQVITGSTGLDDYEWGVTLFGVHPDDLKDCVYEMRFDEASARYAEFGPFYTGMVGTVDEVLTALGERP
jgi:chlorite dismutase